MIKLYRSYDKALAIEPRNVDTLTNMGVSLVALHKYNEAIKYYDKALAIEPTLQNAIVGKHISLQALKNQTQIK